MNRKSPSRKRCRNARQFKPKQKSGKISILSPIDKKTVTLSGDCLFAFGGEREICPRAEPPQCGRQGADNEAKTSRQARLSVRQAKLLPRWLGIAEQSAKHRGRYALAPRGSRVQNIEVSSLFGTVTLSGDCLFAFAWRKLRFSRSFTFVHQTQIEFVSKANGVVSLLAKASPQIFFAKQKASLPPCQLMR